MKMVLTFPANTEMRLPERRTETTRASLAERILVFTEKKASTWRKWSRNGGQ